MTGSRKNFTKNDGYQTILDSLITFIFMNIYNTLKSEGYQTILYSLIAVI